MLCDATTLAAAFPERDEHSAADLPIPSHFVTVTIVPGLTGGP